MSRTSARRRVSSAQNLRDYYNSLAPDWDAWRSRNRFYHEQVKELVAGAVVPDRRVVDIGCGTGDVLATSRPSHGLGLNVADRLTQLAREKYPDLQFETFDPDAVALPDDFRPDYIVSVNLLDHTHDLFELLASVRGCVTERTLIVITTSNPLWAPLLRLASRLGRRSPESPRNFITNRDIASFLLVAVDRSKLLPFGSALDADQLAEVRDAVCLGLRFAGAHQALPLDLAARERWVEVYPRLSAGQPGLAGAATARAEAHVVRLALIYTLLDCSHTIGLEHLAVWRYSAESARWIFGDSLGDPTADEIWAAARERPAGLTRTEVSDMFSRNKKRREIERALGVLEDVGRLRRETRQPDRGRSAEVWIPVVAGVA